MIQLNFTILGITCYELFMIYDLPPPGSQSASWRTPRGWRFLVIYFSSESANRETLRQF